MDIIYIRISHTQNVGL